MNNQNQLRDNIYQFVSTNGPLIPVLVARNFKLEIMMASAYLSELVSDKKLNVTKFLKIGTSPLYYVSGQEGKLVNFLGYLPQRPRQIALLLQEAKILADSLIEPWQRVALREISDFAVPIKLIDNNTEEIFWRWYLLPENEAVSIINVNLKKETVNVQVAQRSEAVQQTIMKEPKRKSAFNFENEVLEYLNRNNLKASNKIVLRKDSDLEFETQMQTNLGYVHFYIKAKKKAIISDLDLSLALNLSNDKKAPVLFLTNGKLTKKGEKFLSQNKLLLFRNIFEDRNIE